MIVLFLLDVAVCQINEFCIRDLGVNARLKAFSMPINTKAVYSLLLIFDLIGPSALPVTEQ